MAIGNIIINWTSPLLLNLELHTGGDVSPDEDLITFFIKGPFTTTTFVAAVQVRFNDFKARQAFIIPIREQQQPVSTLGLASILEVANASDELLDRSRFAGLTEADRLNLRVALKDWIIPINDWQYLAIPKRQFTPQTGDATWAETGQFRLEMQRANDGLYCVSDVLLVGGGMDNGGTPPAIPGNTGVATGGGMQGTYKYKLTNFNSVTGNRSNGTEGAQVAENVNRGAVTLASIPVAADPQVTDVEIWRTLGNGDRYYKIAAVTTGTTTFDDEVADHDSLDSTEGVAVMTTLELPLDNARPQQDFDQFIIDKLTSFWITNTSGEQGRVFFGPIGRPESFKGFLEVSRSGDPLHRLVLYNGQRFAFSESKVYRLDGDGRNQNPFVARELGGIPGVQFAQRRTVQSTPFGIIYQSTDGIRAFNGARSELIQFEALGRIFRGETAEGLPAFEGTSAAFARGEYYISDGTRCLSLNLLDGSWRDVGYNDVTALYYEWDTDKIVAGRVANTQLIEEEGTTADAGGVIAYEWESPAQDGDNDKIMVLERVFVDSETESTNMTTTLVHRFGTIALGTINNAARATEEFVVNQLVLKPSIRFSGSSTARVTVYDAEFEYEPLMMGINVFGGGRFTLEGRYREDLSANGSIVFKVERNVKDFDQTDRLFVIDRLTVEVDTGGLSLVPVITLKNTEVTLTTINTTSRTVVTQQLDRLGPINELRFNGVFFNAAPVAQVFRVELHVRELVIGLNNTRDGRRALQPARASDPETGVTFELNPSFRTLDDLSNLMVLERLEYEVNTAGATLTPSLDIRGGTISPGTINTASRTITEQRLDRIGPLQQLNIAGDFIANAVEFYGLEAYFRPLTLGMNLTSNEQLRPGQDRLEISGRAVAPGTAIEFEVQPFRQDFNQQDGLLWIERIVIEYSALGDAIDVEIDTETGITIAAGTLSATTRTTQELTIQRPGPPKLVRLEANFNTDVRVYSVEIYVRPVDLGVQFRGGQRIKHDGRLTAPTSLLRFTIDPERHEIDGGVMVPLIEVMQVDINTNGVDVTPRILTELGTVILEDINTSARETVTLDIHRVGNLQEVTLGADWTTAIELYGCEVIMRPLTLGIAVVRCQ